MPAAEVTTQGRQRGPGSRPSGYSSGTRVRRGTKPPTQIQLSTDSATRTSGDDPVCATRTAELSAAPAPQQPMPSNSQPMRRPPVPENTSSAAAV